jgi:exosome complex RNA-binding protein Rrp4
MRDATKATDEALGYFRNFVAKLLYLAKRVRPECLVAVDFLTTRVNDVDIDNIAKLHRLLGYLRTSQHIGIVLRVGDIMIVRAYIDASYGVHQSNGKSHTGCAIVLGEAGVLAARSSK